MLRLSPDKTKFQYESVSCHSRFNQYGRLTLDQYKNRNTTQRQNSNSKPTQPSPSKINFSHRHNRSQTQPIENLVNPQFNQKLNKQVHQLKKMGLLGGLVLKNIKYQGHIRIPTVHNDYHSAASNPGYSRKPDGGIYPK